jgi:adenylate kinase family enzyme
MSTSKDSGFERKLDKNGQSNPKYVDLLEEDKPIAGQKFVCVSFVSPDKILKQKEMFFFEEFLKKWELNKSMEKFVQFLNFVSYKYKLNFDDVTKDFQDFIKDERENIAKSSFEDEYKTFLDNSEEELEKNFGIKYNFQTCTRGLKVRGTYSSLEEAELRCKMLREVDPSHDVFVGPVGLWMPWDPEAYKTGRVEYLEEELNQLMSEKTKNEAHAKNSFEQRVKDSKKKAIEENIKHAEKTGSSLTQTIDENGNLISVANMNTTENVLKDNDAISAADIRSELFEGENIVIGKSDNGQSLLVSGPFANKKED